MEEFQSVPGQYRGNFTVSLKLILKTHYLPFVVKSLKPVPPHAGVSPPSLGAGRGSHFFPESDFQRLTTARGGRPLCPHPTSAHLTGDDETLETVLCAADHPQGQCRARAAALAVSCKLLFISAFLAQTRRQAPRKHRLIPSPRGRTCTLLSASDSQQGKLSTATRLWSAPIAEPRDVIWT